jgi:hypothetical protein
MVKCPKVIHFLSQHKADRDRYIFEIQCQEINISDGRLRYIYIYISLLWIVMAPFACGMLTKKEDQMKALLLQRYMLFKRQLVNEY